MTPTSKRRIIDGERSSPKKQKLSPELELVNPSAPLFQNIQIKTEKIEEVEPAISEDLSRLLYNVPLENIGI